MAEHGKLDIQRYFAGEADATSAERIKAHLASCAECAAYLRTLNVDKRAFLARHPFSAFANANLTPRGDPWYRRAWDLMARPSLIPAYATLVLALAALPLIPRIFGPSPAGSGIALKGGQSLSFVYRRDGLTAPGNPADTFHRGDRIQVLFSAARACQVALFSLDSKGALSFYQPDQGGRYCTIAAAAGADQAYPSSIVLDDTHGQELIVALFATQPLETAAVAAWALRHAVGDLRRAESDLRRDPIGADCRVATLLINKG